MEPSTSKPAPSLQELCRIASRQAAAFEPPAARQPAPPPGPGRKRLGVALAAGCAAAMAVAGAAHFVSRPDLPAPADLPPAASALASLTAAQPVAPAEAPPGAPEQPPADAAAPGPVTWQGREMVVELDDTPLPQAVRLLADATGSQVTNLHLLPVQARVSLHWRGRSVTDAWRRLLDGYAASTLSCAQGSCSVLITGLRAAGRAAAGDGGTPAGEAAANAKEELARSQPDDSC